MQHTLYFKKKQEKAYLILKDLAFNTKNICALQYFEGRDFFLFLFGKIVYSLW